MGASLRADKLALNRRATNCLWTFSFSHSIRRIDHAPIIALNGSSDFTHPRIICVIVDRGLCCETPRETLEKMKSHEGRKMFVKFCEIMVKNLLSFFFNNRWKERNKVRKKSKISNIFFNTTGSLSRYYLLV